jgi:hypothetical protein
VIGGISASHTHRRRRRRRRRGRGRRRRRRGRGRGRRRGRRRGRGRRRILVWKPEGRRELVRHRCRWVIILKWILKKYNGRTWTGLIWLTIRTSCSLL